MTTNFKTKFPLKESYIPKHYIIDATNQTLGRLASLVSKLLRGKENIYYTPGVDLGNFVILINSNKIKVSGKKQTEKFYYRQSQRPGSLKKESFLQLNKRISPRIIEKAIWGMLPKKVLGRTFYKRLFVYSDDVFELKKQQTKNESKNFNDNFYIFLKRN